MNTDDPRQERHAPGLRYSDEYVELKMELRDLAGLFRTELAKVSAKIESLEKYIRDSQRDIVRLEAQVQANRTSIASLRTAASLLGAIAGTAATLVTRMLGK